MSATGLGTFDSTVQLTNEWLDELQEDLRFDDRQTAYQALRSVLHALRDRLPVDEAAHLGAQLPMLVRGFYYEGWHPADKPLRERKKEDFLQHVTDEYPRDAPGEPERVTRAVFSILERHVTPGEFEHVRSSLPKGVRELCGCP
ncbi:MAG: DUF2267 domain-containing protein [Planctomycetales bacterium]